MLHRLSDTREGRPASQPGARHPALGAQRPCRTFRGLLSTCRAERRSSKASWLIHARPATSAPWGATSTSAGSPRLGSWSEGPSLRFLPDSRLCSHGCEFYCFAKWNLGLRVEERTYSFLLGESSYSHVLSLGRDFPLFPHSSATNDVSPIADSSYSWAGHAVRI